MHDDVNGMQGPSMPGSNARREFEDYLRGGRLEHGFLRVRCNACDAERLVALSCKRRGSPNPTCAVGSQLLVFSTKAQ